MAKKKADRWTTIVGGLATLAGLVAYYVPEAAKGAIPAAGILSGLWAWMTNKEMPEDNK